MTPAIANAPAYRRYLKKYPQFQTFVDLMPSDNVNVLPPVPYQEFLNDQLAKMEDGVLRVESYRAIIRKMQHEMKQYKKPGVSVTDEFIAERREEARREREQGLG